MALVNEPGVNNNAMFPNPVDYRPWYISGAADFTWDNAESPCPPTSGEHTRSCHSIQPTARPWSPTRQGQGPCVCGGLTKERALRRRLYESEQSVSEEPACGDEAATYQGRPRGRSASPCGWYHRPRGRDSPRYSASQREVVTLG